MIVVGARSVEFLVHDTHFINYISLYLHFNTDHVTSNNNPLNQSINIVIGFTSDVLYEETIFFASRC